MSELQAHIEAENAKYADSYFSVVSDPAHWADYGITTVAQYEHYMAVADYVDTYKEVNGIKPRWVAFDELSIEDLGEMTDSLYAQAHAEREWEAEDDAWIEKNAAANHRYNDMFRTDPEADKYELIAEAAGY